MLMKLTPDVGNPDFHPEIVNVTIFYDNITNVNYWNDYSFSKLKNNCSIFVCILLMSRFVYTDKQSCYEIKLIMSLKMSAFPRKVVFLYVFCSFGFIELIPDLILNRWSEFRTIGRGHFLWRSCLFWFATNRKNWFPKKFCSSFSCSRTRTSQKRNWNSKFPRRLYRHPRKRQTKKW